MHNILWSEDFRISKQILEWLFSLGKSKKSLLPSERLRAITIAAAQLGRAIAWQ